MRTLYVVLALGAQCALADHFSSIPGKLDCPSIRNSMQCARSVEKNLKEPLVRRVNDGRLDVELENGRIHSFIDVDVEGESAVYHSVLESTRNNRYFVIHRQFYEGSGFGLLDRASGNFTKFDGYPIFSQDGHWLAVADGDVNGGTLQIFEVRDHTFRLVFDAEPGTWWPVEVQWTSSTSLAYERASYTAPPRHELVTMKATANFDGRAWR